jgi:hypothetical protein
MKKIASSPAMIIFAFFLLLAFLAAVVVMWSSIDKVIRGNQPPRGAVATPSTETRAALTSATEAWPAAGASLRGSIVTS